VFAFLTLFGLAFLNRFKVTKSSFQKDCVSHVIGLFSAMAFLGLAASSMSFLVPSQMSATSTIPVFLDMGPMNIMNLLQGNLNRFEEMWLNTVGAPIAEEMSYTIALPAILSLIFVGLAWSMPRYKDIFLNKYLQIATFIAVCAPLFMYTHVGMAGAISFAISSLVFRTIQILVVYGDMMVNLIPYTTVVASFAIGFHTGWNVFSYVGFDIGSYITIMASEPLGLLALAVNALFFTVAAGTILNKLSRWL